MFTFGIDMEGLDDWLNRIEKVRGEIVTGLRPLKQAAVFMAKSVQQNFIDQGRPEHWAPLSPMTLFGRAHGAGRSSRGDGSGEPQILRDTGNLMNSMYPIAENGEESAVVGVGTPVPYAATLNFGGYSAPNDVDIKAFWRKTPKGGRARVRAYTIHMAGGYPIPARPFMVLQDDDRGVIAQIFGDWLNDVVKVA